MAGVAIVFPGQGAQHSGMGQSLCEASAAARDVFARVDAMRPGTSAQCFSGSEAELMQTGTTQPCMWAVEMAAAAALREAGIAVDAVAGFSLGEIAALTFSGAVGFESGFSLVCRRGELMEQAAREQEASMAAVLKLDAQAVEALCTSFPGVWPVNYNCPGQTTVAGLREPLQQFVPAVKAAGGLAKLLKVSGGFHSPLMEQAAQAFSAVLADHALQEPGITLYSNYTGLPYQGDGRVLLTKQICSPVRWQAIVEHMWQSGIGTFVEAGPGTTLGGLIRRTLPDAQILSVSDADSCRHAVEVLKGC